MQPLNYFDFRSAGKREREQDKVGRFLLQHLLLFIYSISPSQQSKVKSEVWHLQAHK